MSSEAAHRAFVKAASSMTGECASSANIESPSGCPTSSPSSNNSSACSSSSSAEHAARINMDVVDNKASSSQRSNLGTTRQRSNIPIAASEPPKHQQGAESSDVWIYPSEQQFYNAMKRKGWDPNEFDMHRVVAIHNTVNERAWQHILVWEMLHACDCTTPRLKRFQGKPNEFSPKARLLNFLGFKLPFDRHDWVVDRCGKEVRYIIDFYSGAPQPGVPASMHLDVRPALDSFEALLDRLRMQADWVLSGRWRDE